MNKGSNTCWSPDAAVPPSVCLPQLALCRSSTREKRGAPAYPGARALVFLYREVLDLPLLDLKGVRTGPPQAATGNDEPVGKGGAAEYIGLEGPER
jgi:hypothetical protein